MSDANVVSIGNSPLSPQEKLDKYCEALCDGENKTQAYILAGYSSNHAQRNVAAYHRKHAEYINAYISERFASHVPTALRVVARVMNDEDEKGGIRLKAAEMIFDRAGFAAKQQITVTTKAVEEMSTEDMASEFEKLVSENPELAKVLAFART